MVTAVPGTRRRRKQKQAHVYPRTARARGNAHRVKRENEVKRTGTFVRHGRTQSAEHARKQAQARRQPRDPGGRFVAIARAEEARMRDEIIWGTSKRAHHEDYSPLPRPTRRRAVPLNTTKGQYKRKFPNRIQAKRKGS